MPHEHSAVSPRVANECPESASAKMPPTGALESLDTARIDVQNAREKRGLLRISGQSAMQKSMYRDPIIARA